MVVYHSYNLYESSTSIAHESRALQDWELRARSSPIGETTRVPLM